MPSDRHTRNRAAIRPLRRALYDYDPQTVTRVLAEMFERDAQVHLAFPFEDLEGHEELFARAIVPLAAALCSSGSRLQMAVFR